LSDVGSSPQPLVLLRDYATSHHSKSRSYELLSWGGLISVMVREYETMPPNADIPCFQQLKRTATLEGISAYPSKWGRVGACLALTSDHDERIRLLIRRSSEKVVIVLKYLTLSWNDVLASLEKELIKGE
jgi:hypothetical protein